MSSYSFVKTILKTPAFDDYLRRNLSATLYDGIGVSGDNVVVLTKVVLTPEQLGNLTQLVNDYVDPEIFLQYNRTESVPLYSQETNSTSLAPIQTLIFTNRNDSNQVLDCCKTILEYIAEDVSHFANETSASVTFELFDITRNWQIATQTIDISDIIATWKALETGSNIVYRSALFCGLHNKVTDYDCIWQFRISVSNPNIKIRMNGLQYIFYDVL